MASKFIKVLSLVGVNVFAGDICEIEVKRSEDFKSVLLEASDYEDAVSVELNSSAVEVLAIQLARLAQEMKEHEAQTKVSQENQKSS